MTPTRSSEPVSWGQPHLGRLLGYALQRFDDRVLVLLASDDEVPLALSRLASRQQISAAHVHVLRHLPPAGARLTTIAARAHMTKQAMGDLVDQCAAWGLVTREPDPHDRRARRIRYTPLGLQWQQAFLRAVTQAEREFRDEVGAEVAAVIRLGLEAYAGAYGTSP